MWRLSGYRLATSLAISIITSVAFSIEGMGTNSLASVELRASGEYVGAG